MNSSAFSALIKALHPKQYEVFYTLNGQLFRVVGVIQSVILYDEVEPDIERLVLSTDLDPWVDIELSCINSITEIV